jgi:hypothetical protein
MARTRRTVGGRGKTINTLSRLGRGTLRASYSGGKRTGIFAHKQFPRLVGRTRINLSGGRNGGWLNPRNW